MDIQSKKSLAFVCSGGAVKAAAFHVGVVLALQEKGFSFVGGTKLASDAYQPAPFKGINIYVGSSAGAFIAGCLASGFSVESIIKAFGGNEYKSFKHVLQHAKPLKAMGYMTMFGLTKSPARRLKQLFHAQPYEPPFSMGMESMLRKAFRLPGVFSTDGIESYFRKTILKKNDFHELASQLFIVTTQLNHSRKVVFGAKDMDKSATIQYSSRAPVSQAIAASLSLPPLYEPYSIPNERGERVWYMDGEIRETLSTHVAKDAGADLIFVSYTHQPYHFHPDIGSLTEYGVPAICVQALYQAIEQKINASQRRKKQKLQLLDLVHHFFEEHELDNTLKEKLIHQIEQTLGFKRNIDYIYIHPKPQDYEMFFGDHFSLNPKHTERILRIGFRCALAALREHGL